jgi:16S rRNA (cytosine967-C5)-methyltransferase
MNKGLLPRAEAVRLLQSVLRQGASFDDAFGIAAATGPLSKSSPSDRRLCYAIVATALRRKGELDCRLAGVMPKPLPKSAGPAHEILLVTAAQLLFMRVPSHAAVSLAVTVAKANPQAKHFASLINAVGRKISSQSFDDNTGTDPSINTPSWLYRRWRDHYGPSTAQAIARAHLEEPPLDLTVLGDPQTWAHRLHGSPASGQTVRLTAWHGSIADLPGFAEGQWWVQDEASSLPARLLGNVKGKRILDLCAAPGGKTAQLATAGAHVTAIDRSQERMEKLRANLDRLKVSAETVICDALEFQSPEPFDAVLLDAPCSGTGTIRRHPDLPYHRIPKQIGPLAELQHRLLNRCVSLTKPDGLIVFSTCSLEPEEGEDQLTRLSSDLRHIPVQESEFSLTPRWLNAQGCIRTLPNQGLDGFFAMRLKRV